MAVKEHPAYRCENGSKFCLGVNVSTLNRGEYFLKVNQKIVYLEKDICAAVYGGVITPN